MKKCLLLITNVVKKNYFPNLQRFCHLVPTSVWPGGHLGIDHLFDSFFKTWSWLRAGVQGCWTPLAPHSEKFGEVLSEGYQVRSRAPWKHSTKNWSDKFNGKTTSRNEIILDMEASFILYMNSFMAFYGFNMNFLIGDLGQWLWYYCSENESIRPRFIHYRKPESCVEAYPPKPSIFRRNANQKIHMRMCSLE